MKRIAFILTLSALFHINIVAQSVHPTGDTIEQTPPNGYIDWWDWDAAIENKSGVGISYNSDFSSLRILCMPLYTPTPLRVVGIGALLFARDPNTYCQVDSTRYQQYLYLFQSDNSCMTKKGKIPINLKDSHRYIHITGPGKGITYDNSVLFFSNDSSTCCSKHQWDSVFSLYEHYFDSAITVHDTFYLGFSFSGFDWDNPDSLIHKDILRIGIAWYRKLHCEEVEVPIDLCIPESDLNYMLYYSYKSATWRSTLDDSWVSDEEAYLSNWPNNFHLLMYAILETETGDSLAIHTPALLADGIFISPNPASDRLTITSTHRINHVDIYNQQGILVFSENRTGHTVNIDTGTYPTGHYIVIVSTYDGSFSKNVSLIK